MSFYCNLSGWFGLSHNSSDGAGVVTYKYS